MSLRNRSAQLTHQASPIILDKGYHSPREKLPITNQNHSRQFIESASRPTLTLDQDKSKHIIESSLDQGNLVYKQTQGILKQGAGIFKKLFDDLSTGKSKSPLRDLLFLAGTLVAGGFTLNSAVNTLKSFSPNSKNPAAISVIKTIVGFSLMKSLYNGSINKSFINPEEGSKQVKNLSGRVALLTLLWLFENNKLPNKTKEDITDIASVGNPVMHLAKRIFTGFY
jgi:hypothetical protein